MKMTIFLSVIAVITFSACSSATPEPPNPVTGEWQADGVISPGEYSRVNTFDNGNYELHHHIEGGFIYVGLKANTTGWVAVGFISGSSLTQVDFIIGSVVGTLVTVSDQFASEHPGEHEDDRFAGGTADILEKGGKETGGVTVIEFKRALDTGDAATDVVIVPGNRIILWAYSTIDDFIYHAARGFDNIRLG